MTDKEIIEGLDAIALPTLDDDLKTYAEANPDFINRCLLIQASRNSNRLVNAAKNILN